MFEVLVKVNIQIVNYIIIVIFNLSALNQVKYGLISDSFHKQILIPYKKISIGLSALEKKILEILDILFVGFQG